MFSEAVSIVGKQVDKAFFVILGICLFMLVLITVLMVFFVIRYSRKRHPHPVNIEGNNLLEIVWTVVPTLLVLLMFYYGWLGYESMERPPEDALVVEATAQMWSWSFEYENGKQTDQLQLPVDKAVALKLTSRDVLHSFYVPAFRIKKDMVPGMTTLISFTPDEVGTYDLFCTEYCGVGHSAMLSTVVVVPEQEFASWLAGKEAPEEASGLQLLESKGCRACHSIDGTKKVGPTLQGSFGKTRRVVTNGQERDLPADEDYLRRSLMEPGADVVSGYPSIMPSQKDLLTEEEILLILETLKGL